jgi:uncharacterized membrane protein YheB (UPF0754 family)
VPLVVTPTLLALFGAATGGSASYVTVRMFFSPHRGKRWLGMKVPFTPGLFPHIQPRLADRLANDVQQTLLTPSEIHELAARILTKENIEKAVDLGLEAVVSEFRNTTKLHALAHDVARLATEMMGQTVSAVIQRALSGESQVFDIATMVDRAVDFMLSEFEVTPKLATYLADRIMEGPLAPAALRVRLVEFLTPDAIEALSRAIKRHTSGGLGLLLGFVNLRGGLTKFRMFMEEDPTEAEAMLQQVLTSADVRGLVEREIREFKLKQLPWSTIEFLKTNTTSYIEHYLQTHQDTLVPQILERLELDVLIADAIIRLDPNKVSPQLMGRIRSELVHFILRYLDQDLAALVEHFVGALMIQMIIAEKVRRFPSPLLETAIRETGWNRLVGMVLAGAGIGAVFGGTFGWLVL